MTCPPEPPRRATPHAALAGGPAPDPVPQRATVEAVPASFWVGAPDPGWLARTTVPLCVSHHRLARRQTLPRSTGAWILDSGAFTELRDHGRWTVDHRDYVDAVRRYRDDIGGMVWSASQDMPCEDHVLRATGSTVTDHIRATVHNYLDLRCADPDLPFVPVLQGRSPADYLRCADLYHRYGVDVTAEPIVGVGSVCGRPALSAALLFDQLHAAGLRSLHGFGVDRRALMIAGERLSSVDSMAWSAGARYETRCPENPLRRGCRNCLHRAEEYAEETQAILDGRPNGPASV